MSGDAHVQFWEGLGVRLPGATQPGRHDHDCAREQRWMNRTGKKEGRSGACCRRRVLDLVLPNDVRTAKGALCAAISGLAIASFS